MDVDKRYQVFVSSTYLDLKDERAAVVSALLNLDAIPAGMELFPAADDDAWTLIEDVIADSDYYLLIIGGKYGSIDPELDISYTEREYDTAVRLQKPVMAFLHADPGNLLANQSENSDQRREKLVAFRQKVARAKHVKYWTSAEDLAGKVALSWNTFRRRYPAIGWIKADQTSSRESLEALAKAQKEIEDLRAQLESVRTKAPAGTERLAQGDNKFILPVLGYGSWTAVKQHAPTHVRYWVTLYMTWNRVFGYMALRMMQEADEPTLEEDLCSVVLFEHEDRIREEFARTVRHSVEDSGLGDDWEVSHRFGGIQVTDEDFQTVLLQFDALGLIQHSQRKNRSVKDTANYWTLTPYGRTVLQQLRAIQAGEESLARLDGPTNADEAATDNEVIEPREPEATAALERAEA